MVNKQANKKQSTAGTKKQVSKTTEKQPHKGDAQEPDKLESQTDLEVERVMAKSGKIARIVGLVVVIGLILLTIISSTTAKPAIADQVWTENAVIGNLDAKNYYIMYTDLACPYCDVFSRLTMENEDEFNQFLSDNDIAFEVRVTDYLYEGSDIDYSHAAADGVYCAEKSSKYIEYYHAAVQALWDDYQSRGYGSSKTAPAITGMPDDYWEQIGLELGLGEDFSNCMNNHEADETITANTAKAIKVFQANSSGLPYFQFNDYTYSGFDNSWGWDMAKELLKEGLE